MTNEALSLVVAKALGWEVTHCIGTDTYNIGCLAKLLPCEFHQHTIKRDGVEKPLPNFAEDPVTLPEMLEYLSKRLKCFAITYQRTIGLVEIRVDWAEDRSGWCDTINLAVANAIAAMAKGEAQDAD